jgi:hypothetical protein
MSSNVVFVNVLDVRCECETGLARARGAVRIMIAT